MDDAFANLTLGEELGRGGFGVVRRGKTNGRDVAVKVMDLDALEEKHPDAVATLVREVTVMRGLDHANILKLYAWRRDDDERREMEMILELCEAPRSEVIGAAGAVGEAAARRVGRQVVDAVVYLHERQIIHRDLKTENVMLAEPLARAPLSACRVKLIDFGLAPAAERGADVAPGDQAVDPRIEAPPAVGAPETVHLHGGHARLLAAGARLRPRADRGHGRRALHEIDAFSLGKVLRHMLTGVSPELTIMQGLEAQGTDCGCFKTGKIVKIVSPAKLSDAARDLMARLAADADDRLSIAGARDHAFFTQK
ncbi:serine/threonine kinase [Aureococcus anophagefferens]|nr:serine/threonine kinase [Aureococcus anophagefferens]